MKLLITPGATLDIYKRHRGPYVVMLGEYLPRLDVMRTRVSKLKFVRAEDVDTYCRQIVDEEEYTLTASVMTARDGYWITTYVKQPDLQDYVDRKATEWNERFETEEKRRGRR